MNIILNENNLDIIRRFNEQWNRERTRTRYTNAAIPERIKKDLAVVLLDIPEYIKEIEKWKQNTDPKYYIYNYQLDLDLSIDTKDPESISHKIYEDRLYYYRAHHYLKLGIFKKEDAPKFKVQFEHLSQDVLYDFFLLNYEDRNIILKRAVARIFEEINFDLYHDSMISTNLEVELVNWPISMMMIMIV